MKMNRIITLLAFTALSATSAFAQDTVISTPQSMVPQGMMEGTQSFDSSAQLSAQPEVPSMQQVEAQIQPVPVAVQPVSQATRKVIKVARNYIFPTEAPKSMSNNYKQDGSRPFKENAEYQPLYTPPSSTVSYNSGVAPQNMVSSNNARGAINAGTVNNNIKNYKTGSQGLGYVVTPGKSENFDVVNPNVSATATTNLVPTKKADYTDGGKAPTVPVTGLTVQTSSGARIIREDTKVYPTQYDDNIVTPVSSPDDMGWRNPDSGAYGEKSRGNGGANKETNPVSKGSFFFFNLNK